MNNNKTTEFENDLIDECTFEVCCINCGDIVMYANPKHYEGQRLPDMICLKCKYTRQGREWC